MKDVRRRVIELLQTGYCTPQIAQLARKTGIASATLHYNIKKLEEDGAIRGYKAITNPRRTERGYTTYILVTLSSDEYGDPEKIASDLATRAEVESIDIITGDWELIVKLHTRDMDTYYEFAKNVISRRGIAKIKSLSSLKAVKSEFVSY